MTSLPLEGICTFPSYDTSCEGFPSSPTGQISMLVGFANTELTRMRLVTVTCRVGKCRILLY